MRRKWSPASPLDKEEETTTMNIPLAVKPLVPENLP